MSKAAASAFYKFKEERYWKGAPPIVGFADRKTVAAVIGISELDAVFGGHLEYEALVDGQRYVGVWSARKVDRFRRLLRERGVETALEPARPDQFRQRHRSKKGAASASQETR